MDSTVQILHINMSRSVDYWNLSDYYRKNSSIESMWVYSLYLNKIRFADTFLPHDSKSYVERL